MPKRTPRIWANSLGKVALIFLMIYCVSSSFANPRPGVTREATIPKFSTTPRIDGLLDDECWREAERLGGFTEADPREGAKPEVETNVLLGYDERNLYIGLVCHENDISQIRTREGKRDTYTEGDFVQISLDTYNTSTSAYTFIVNPSGVQMDASERGDVSDISFDIEWYASSRILDDRWTVEIAIPFKSLRFPSRDRQHWRVHFFRYRPRESEAFYSWVPLSRDESSLFAEMGHLYINDRLLTGERISFLPYLITAQSEEESFTSKLGLSGKCWLSSDFICDWALSPNYAQIESDQPQINVNTTFALYYPEKRPFFLERKGLFETPIQAIYTRTINDPLIALKFTGKLGKMNIGYITALDKHTPWVVPFAEQSVSMKSNKRSLSNILRISYDLRSESHLGLLATSRELRESYNRVFGVDGRLKFLKNYYLSFQGLLSATEEPDDSTLFEGYPWLKFGKYTSGFDGENFTGKAFALKLSRNARHLGFDLWYNGYSPEFRAENGYIQRNDLKTEGIDTKLNFWPNRYMIHLLTLQVEVGETEGYKGGEREKYLTPSLFLLLKRQTYLTLNYTRSAKTFQDQRFDKIWTTQVIFSSNYSKFFSPGISYKYGREINYFVYPYKLGYLYWSGFWFDFKPLSQLSLYFNYGKYLLKDENKREIAFDQRTFQYKLTYSLSHQLTTRLIIQDYSNRKEMDLSPLLSFQVSPFTALYIGSNHTVEKLPGTLKQTDYQVFLKLQYRIWI
jgi:hypothetical protein